MVTDPRSDVDEIERLITAVFWTEKAQFAMAGVHRAVRLTIGLIATTASCVATASIVAEQSPTLAGVASLVAAMAAALLTFLKPDESAQQHLSVARELGALRVDMRQARHLQLPYVDDPEARRTIIAGLTARKASIDARAPHVPNLAIRLVRRRLDRGEFGSQDDLEGQVHEG